MPFAPGQSGNPGGKTNSKLFREALLASLKKADGDAERIQRVADKLVENAMAGETAAIREIADRVDGKVPQAIVGDDEHAAIRTVTEVKWTIVDPKSTDAPRLPSAPGSGSV